MHAEQFRAIIVNLPLHQLCKYLCEKAQEDGSEVYGTLLWVPEEGRLALLDCLTASLESPPLTPRSAAGGDTAADAAGSSSPLQADAAGGSSTLPAASGSSSTLPSAGPASSADPGTLPHFGKDAADPPLRDPSTQDSAAAAQDATDPPLQDPVQDTTPDPLLSEGMKFSSTAVGGVENRVRVIHMGGFTETMVFFDLHTHPKIFGLPDRHLVSKRDFGHRAGNF